MKLFFRENFLFTTITAAFLVGAYLLPKPPGTAGNFNPSMYLYSIDILVRYAVAFIAIIFIKDLILNFSNGYGTIFTSINNIKINYLRPARLFGFILLLLLTPVYFFSYTTFKRSMNQAKPFLFDEYFKDLDYLLHAGNHPWELLLPLSQNANVILFFDWLYSHGWYISWITIFTWAAWTVDRRTRWIFFANFCLAWILLGTFMANMLSSAGPCYFDKVTGSLGPYLPLFEHLNSICREPPLSALSGQKLLWEAYLGGALIEGAGISAMPSMHLSIMTTCTLGAWALNRVVGCIYIILTGCFLVGSVLLGWHYAVDGYVSIFLTVLLWYLLAKVADAKFDNDSKAAAIDHHEL